MYKNFFLIGMCLFLCNSFNLNRNWLNNIHVQKNSLEKINHIQNKKKKAIIFFTGGSSFISHRIYSNFQYNINLYNNSIYIPFYNFKHPNKLINYLDKHYDSITVVGHSSGCSTGIRFCKDNPKINKLVLLDPVDTFFDTDRIILPYINNILIINAGKSYKINTEPFGLPFIPIFSLKKKKLKLTNNCKVIKLVNNSYGHADILDYIYSNFMHFTRISVGFTLRNKRNINSYHKWLAYNICNLS